MCVDRCLLLVCLALLLSYCKGSERDGKISEIKYGDSKSKRRDEFIEAVKAIKKNVVTHQKELEKAKSESSSSINIPAIQAKIKQRNSLLMLTESQLQKIMLNPESQLELIQKHCENLPDADPQIVTPIFVKKNLKAIWKEYLASDYPSNGKSVVKYFEDKRLSDFGPGALVIAQALMGLAISIKKVSKDDDYVEKFWQATYNYKYFERLEKSEANLATLKNSCKKLEKRITAHDLSVLFSSIVLSFSGTVLLWHMSVFERKYQKFRAQVKVKIDAYQKMRDIVDKFEVDSATATLDISTLYKEGTGNIPDLYPKMSKQAILDDLDQKIEVLEGLNKLGRSGFYEKREKIIATAKKGYLSAATLEIIEKKSKYHDFKARLDKRIEYLEQVKKQLDPNGGGADGGGDGGGADAPAEAAKALLDDSAYLKELYEKALKENVRDAPPAAVAPAADAKIMKKVVETELNALKALEARGEAVFSRTILAERLAFVNAVKVEALDDHVDISQDALKDLNLNKKYHVVSEKQKEALKKLKNVPEASKKEIQALIDQDKDLKLVHDLVVQSGEADISMRNRRRIASGTAVISALTAGVTLIVSGKRPGQGLTEEVDSDASLRAFFQRLVYQNLPRNLD